MATSSAVPLRRGILSISAAAIVWGVGGAAASILFRISDLGPVAVSFWRLAIAALVLAVARVVRPVTAPSNIAMPRRPRWMPVTTGIGLALYQTAYFGAVQQTGLALSTMITLGAGPIFIAAGARVLLHERLGRRGTIALGIALAGLMVLLGGSLTAGPASLLGVALALLSATGYSAVTLVTRAAGGGGATATSFGIGLLCLLPLAIGEGIWPGTANLLSTIGWLLFLGVVSTLLAYRWYFTALATVPAATAAVIVLLEPVTAAILAVMLLGEHLTTNIVGGSCLLLASVALLAWNKTARPVSTSQTSGRS